MQDVKEESKLATINQNEKEELIELIKLAGKLVNNINKTLDTVKDSLEKL